MPVIANIEIRKHLSNLCSLVYFANSKDSWAGHDSVYGHVKQTIENILLLMYDAKFAEEVMDLYADSCLSIGDLEECIEQAGRNRAEAEAGCNAPCGCCSHKWREHVDGDRCMTMGCQCDGFIDADMTPETTVLKLHGHEYTVVHEGSNILTIACKGRYPATAPNMIGNDWIVGEISRHLTQE